VALTANTNIQWWGKLSGGTAVPSVAPTGYNTPTSPDVRLVTVPLDERDPLSASSWTTTPVTVQAGHDGIPPDMEERDFMRAPHSLTISSPSPATGISAAGSFTATFTGTASEYRIQLQTGTTWNPNNNVGGVQTIYGNGTGKTLTYPANPGGQRRLYFYNNITQARIGSNYFTQNAKTYVYGPYLSMPSFTVNCPSGGAFIAPTAALMNTLGLADGEYNCIRELKRYYYSGIGYGIPSIFYKIELGVVTETILQPRYEPFAATYNILCEL
jgi:hypothetical protein